MKKQLRALMGMVLVAALAGCSLDFSNDKDGGPPVVDSVVHTDADVPPTDALPAQEGNNPYWDLGCVKTNGGTEICDGKDNDCNGKVDDVSSLLLQSDIQNCGACNNVCKVPFATPKCSVGKCEIDTCNTGRWNANKVMADGCECQKAAEFEICDNDVDDDCDGKVDGSGCWEEKVKYDFSKTPSGLPPKVSNQVGSSHQGYYFDPLKFGQPGPSGNNAAAFNGGWIQVGAGSEGNFDGGTAKYLFKLWLDKLAKDVSATSQLVMGTGFGCYAPNRAWALAETNGKFVLTWSEDGTKQHWLSTVMVSAKKWYTLGVRLDGKTISIAIDGKVYTDAGKVYKTSNPLKIAAGDKCANTPKLMGRMADFRVYTQK